jgi:hypothetical protein
MSSSASSASMAELVAKLQNNSDDFTECRLFRQMLTYVVIFIGLGIMAIVLIVFGASFASREKPSSPESQLCITLGLCCLILSILMTVFLMRDSDHRVESVWRMTSDCTRDE